MLGCCRNLVMQPWETNEDKTFHHQEKSFVCIEMLFALKALAYRKVYKKPWS